MASFFIIPSDTEFNNTMYELHATSNIDVTFKTSFSKQPTQGSGAQSDNIIVDPIVVKFVGVLTDVSIGGGLIDQISDRLTKWPSPFVLTIGDYIEELRQLQIEKTLFDVTFSGDATTGGKKVGLGLTNRRTNNNTLESVKKAIITVLHIHKDASLGTSWKVDITLQQENTIPGAGKTCTNPNLCDETTSAEATKKVEKEKRDIIFDDDRAYDRGAMSLVNREEALKC